MEIIYFAGHGSFAQGLKDSVKLICGNVADEIRTYCLNLGDDVNDFVLEINKLAVDKNNKVVVFTDLFGASITNSLIPLTCLENFKLICGTNLNLVLEYLMTKPNFTDDLKMSEIIESAKNGIKEIKIKRMDNYDF